MRVIFFGRRSIRLVALSLFVAGAVFREIWNDSTSTKCCNFQLKCSWRARKVTSVTRRVAD